jgi:hypothetical protein
MMNASDNASRSVSFVFAVMVLALLTGTAAATETVPAPETVALSIEGISSTSSEDNPGILYILPWQPPTLPRRTREGLSTNASELLEPLEPTAFEGHQNFQQSLNPALNSKNQLR